MYLSSEAICTDFRLLCQNVVVRIGWQVICWASEWAVQEQRCGVPESSYCFSNTFVDA